MYSIFCIILIILYFTYYILIVYYITSIFHIDGILNILFIYIYIHNWFPFLTTTTTRAQSFSPARGATPAIGVLCSAILETASARHWRWALHFFVAAPRVVTPSSNAAIEALLGSLAAVKKWALCFGEKQKSFLKQYILWRSLILMAQPRWLLSLVYSLVTRAPEGPIAAGICNFLKSSTLKDMTFQLTPSMTHCPAASCGVMRAGPMQKSCWSV